MMDKKTTMTPASVKWQIAGVWIAAITLSGFASEIQSIAGGILHFGLVGAIWISGWLKKGNWQVTNSKIIRSILVGVLAIGMRQTGYEESNIVKPSYTIVSEIPEVIQTETYTLTLGVTDTKIAKINEDVVNVINDKIEKTFDLIQPETKVKITLGNDDTAITDTIILTRKMTDEEKTELKAQKAEEERLKKEKEEQAERETMQEDMRRYPVRYIEVVKNGWTLGGFGTVASHDITLKNTSDIDYKDITVVATYYSPSGTKLSSSVKTIYEVLPAGKTIIFRDINMGFVNDQVAKASVSVSDAEIK